ncbi:MAG: serine hydrolase, partial [Bacteroidetes bacterium]|nr:serine hydrolase [Bacteroidota bacterium]
MFLFSCQTTKEDKKIVVTVPEKDTLQEQVLAPAFFTSDSAQLLGSQLDSIFNTLHKHKGFNGTVLITKYNQVVYKG